MSLFLHWNGVPAFLLMTRTDKTTFVDNITGSNLPISSDYGDGTCTKKPEVVVSLIDGKTVAFIDTPGWDDDQKDSIPNSLKVVSRFLEGQLGSTWPITAALYFYDINQRRETKSAQVNLDNFNAFF
ncbi:hypothetical protein BDZ45DRAFT_746341 [Acephala macrosclerotiorum]|nr:hypothetical protein BDZ45DRAFT_746341 [Acephala macrosclerotiorum]